MNVVVRKLVGVNLALKRQINVNTIRMTQTVSDRVLEKSRRSKLGKLTNGPSVEDPNEAQEASKQLTREDHDYKFIYPDFLPNPVYYFRDKVREKLERMDMINRRKQINIPEFYVGSIMAVTVSDPYSPTKSNKFVGICIRREDYGLKHVFTLRNVIDGLGVEIKYHLYNPTIQSIEVLKLEKRLDDDLSYLRDAPLEYSTVPFDFKPVILPPGSKVPLNDLKIKLNPRPWFQKWDRKFIKGIQLPERQSRADYERYVKSSDDFNPYHRYDLMKHYREGLNDNDFVDIVSDLKQFEGSVKSTQEQVQETRKIKRVRNLPNSK